MADCALGVRVGARTRARLLAPPLCSAAGASTACSRSAAMSAASSAVFNTGAPEPSRKGSAAASSSTGSSCCQSHSGGTRSAAEASCAARLRLLRAMSAKPGARRRARASAGNATWMSGGDICVQDAAAWGCSPSSLASESIECVDAPESVAAGYTAGVNLGVARTCDAVLRALLKTSVPASAADALGPLTLPRGAVGTTGAGAVGEARPTRVMKRCMRAAASVTAWSSLAARCCCCCRSWAARAVAGSTSGAAAGSLTGASAMAACAAVDLAVGRVSGFLASGRGVARDTLSCRCLASVLASALATLAMLSTVVMVATAARRCLRRSGGRGTITDVTFWPTDTSAATT